MERHVQSARRPGISRRGARALAVVTGYLNLMLSIATPLVASVADILAGTALTLAELLFVIGVPAAALAYMLTRRTPWRPSLATALTLVPLPAGLFALLLHVLAR